MNTVIPGQVLQLVACNLHLFERLTCNALLALSFPKNYCRRTCKS